MQRKMGIVLGAVVAAAAMAAATSGQATTYTLTINDPSQSINEVDTISTPFTPHQGWSQGPLQSWGFGGNNIEGGGWLDFFNDNNNYGGVYPAGEIFQKEGGADGNVSFTTTSPFYILTGFGPTYQLSISDGLGWGKLTTYNLTDGGTLTITAVPEPTTWAMLILGMGVVGVALRRRTVALAA